MEENRNQHLFIVPIFRDFSSVNERCVLRSKNLNIFKMFAVALSIDMYEQKILNEGKVEGKVKKKKSLKVYFRRKFLCQKLQKMISILLNKFLKKILSPFMKR